MKELLALSLALAVLVLCGCSSQAQDQSVQETQPAQEIQYDYPLKAGEQLQVEGMTFDEQVTVTVDPASTRNGDNDLRSSIYFENCNFNGGLTVVGDYHAMIMLGGGCTFGEGSTVTVQEANPGATRDMVLEDNLVKLLVYCQGVSVESQGAMGLLTAGPDVVLNGTTYSKEQLTPDTDLLGVYALYEGDTMTYLKLGIGEDDSVIFLE